MHETIDQPGQRGRRRFLSIVLLLTVAALLVRLLFFFFAKVDYPVRGDVREYFFYGWNLLHHATLSAAAPGSESVVPDAFRPPGYPSFLALGMAMFGESASAIRNIAVLQIVLSCAVVPLTVALARTWLSRQAALLCGVLVAFWPHLVVFAGTLLAETLFGLLLLAMLLLMRLAQRDGRPGFAIAAGLAGGGAYLFNPVILFFPPLLAIWLACRSQARMALLLALAFSSVAGAWAMRNAMQPLGAGSWSRAAVNIVEGSWPQYHAAYNSRWVNPVSASIMAAIDEEERLMVADPAAGLRKVSMRLSSDPAYYLGWYLLRKPYSLWSWNVRIGWGDVYFLAVRDSPYDRNPVLRAVHAAFKAGNPLVFALALLAATGYLFRSVFAGCASTSHEPWLAGIFFLYVTAIHVVFQADPRYAVAYRPIEIVLAVAALVAVSARIRALRSGAGVAEPAVQDLGNSR